MPQLLTAEDKEALFQRLFSDRLLHGGQFYLPNVEFYNLLRDDEGLTRAAKLMCRWIGIKPYRLNAAFTDETTHNSDKTHICIPSKYREFPYQAGSLLALGVIHHLLAHRDPSLEYDEGFVESTSLRLGLGIVILNGLHGRRSLQTHLHRIIKLRWYVHNDVQLATYRPVDYGGEVLAFARTYRISAEGWYAYVSDEARGLIPLRLAHTPHVRPQLERQHRRAAHQWWTRLWLGAFIIALLASICLYVLAQRAPHISKIQAERYETIQILSNAFRTCERAVRQQQNTADLQDIYADMSVNAAKSRCQSIRNKYNYFVTQFNQNITP